LAEKQVNTLVIAMFVFVLTGKFLERVINDHARAVNRICFQPDNGNILLSASQDGTMKCWVRLPGKRTENNVLNVHAQ
jgi:WD40 repeat protein